MHTCALGEQTIIILGLHVLNLLFVIKCLFLSSVVSVGASAFVALPETRA